MIFRSIGRFWKGFRANQDEKMMIFYGKPFFYDDRFPMGMLRESKNNAYRADLMVYSNCPKNIVGQKLKRFIET